MLTGSNPLTVLFWAGVFSAKVAAEGYGRAALWSFSLGCIAATVGFLVAVALAGGLVAHTAPPIVIRSLNVAVGCALVYFAVRLMLVRVDQSGAAGEPR